MGGRTGLVVGGVVAAAVLIGGTVGVLYATGAGPFKASSAPAAKAEVQSGLAKYARGGLTSLKAPVELAPAPDYAFLDRDGKQVRFADFRGKVVVVNLWAMWCAPCRTEMPTLARLAEAYTGRDLVVLPINVDAGDDKLAEVTSFIDVHEPLPLYRDPKFELPFQLPGKTMMPQTVVLDRQGRIRAHFSGEADWASPEARALVDALLAEPA